MATPATVDDFRSILSKSKLVEDEGLDTFLRTLEPVPEEPERLAEALIDGGLLTRFQVDNLLKGRWHRFFIGHYKVLDRLGSGNYGSVYLCEHQKMRRRVAIKVLLSDKAKDEASLLRFEREARAAAALDHPNIVRAYDLCREDHLHYLVMDYIEGVSFRQMLLNKEVLTPEQVVDYMRQAAEGLQHAHESGLIHRDLKPANFMVTPAGVVKLLDLGLARFADDDIDLTRGAVLGHALYMPPEQAQDSHGVDARADVYSLGATFYHCLTGKRATSGSLSGESPRLPPDADQELLAKLMKLFQQMMAADPADRPQTAGEVATILSSWRTSAATHDTAMNGSAPRTEFEITALSGPSDDLSPSLAELEIAVTAPPASNEMPAFKAPPAPAVRKVVKKPLRDPAPSRTWVYVVIGVAVLALVIFGVYMTTGTKEYSGPTRPPLPTNLPTPKWTPQPVSPNAPR
jgi:serine/threonine protein kinase